MIGIGVGLIGTLPNPQENILNLKEIKDQVPKGSIELHFDCFLAYIDVLM